MDGHIIKHAHHGIGKVVGVQPGQVRIRFLSGQEMAFKPHAFKDGILARAKLSVGSRCIGLNGECTVRRIAALAGDAPIEYEVTYESGLSAVVSEVALTPLPGRGVQDPLLQFAGLDLQSYGLFRLRERLVNANAKSLREGSGLRALLSSRIDLRPHQAYVAGVVLLDLSRRYLLADEVGLGKTIEAGIVVHDLLTTKPDARVLVLCPSALAQQWLCELYAKFGGQVFTLLDLHAGKRINWQGLQKVIASTTLAAYDLSKELSKIAWDIVVVDEAHHLINSPVLYEFVRQLSRSVPSLLLLSAIPAQRREDDFLRLLALLEPDRYQSDSCNAQEEFRTLYSAQSAIGRRLRRLSRRIEGVSSGDSTPEEVKELALSLIELPVLSEDKRLNSMIALLETGEQAFIDDARAIVHYVADRYRIHRRILRNRKTRLIEEGQIQLIQRRFAPFPYQPEQVEIELVEAVEAIIRELRQREAQNDVIVPFVRTALQSLVLPTTARDFLERLADADSGRLNSKGMDYLAMGYMFGYEDWEDYAELVCVGVRGYLSDELAEHALARATAWCRSAKAVSRWDVLVKLLRSRQQQTPLPKILIFAGFPGAAEALAERLRAEFGNQAVKEFRFDLSQEEKELSVRQFQTNPATWLLVSDETGGEGRNFQFAAELVHFDTPWYAARVEQRIGRLDRLGREKVRSDVVSNVIFSEGSVEDGLICCYRAGMKVYEQSISGLEFALREVERRIAEVAIDRGYEGLCDYVEELSQLAEQERAQDESESVLDEASFELRAAERYRKISHARDGDKLLEEAFVGYFRGISSERSAKEIYDPAFPRGIWKFVVDDARFGQLPFAGQEGDGLQGEVKGTFLREIAQQRPDLNFFNVGNPFFDAVIRSLVLHPTGRTYAIACCVAEHEPWMGFEYVFFAAPDLKPLANNYGLVNQALGLFTAPPLRLFCDGEGNFTERAGELLTIRSKLKLEHKNGSWWNLTKEKSRLLPQSFGQREWPEAVSHTYQLARDRARRLFRQRLALTLEAETARIAEQIRQAKGQPERFTENEVAALLLLLDSITNWGVELDSLGFLSLNEITV
ncbi:MAG: RNA polymerase-associated protein RapA [Gammaproteobacteria bacterium]|nr:RNA polymerase-associated protein RapA [Gammaproteobacteria bacterium]